MNCPAVNQAQTVADTFLATVEANPLPRNSISHHGVISESRTALASCRIVGIDLPTCDFTRATSEALSSVAAAAENNARCNSFLTLVLIGCSQIAVAGSIFRTHGTDVPTCDFTDATSEALM